VVKLPVVQMPLSRILLLLVSMMILSAGSSWSAPALYDPLRPQGGTPLKADVVAVEDALRLEVIVIADNRCSAVINGHSVVVGDQLKGYRVKTIRADAVILSGCGENKRLILHAADQAKMQVLPVAN